MDAGEDQSRRLSGRRRGHRCDSAYVSAPTENTASTRVGEGTGLGLDIGQRIIRNYKGFGWSRKPGRTVFQVRLPCQEFAGRGEKGTIS